jgi:repressor of nif and glnA expression
LKIYHTGKVNNQAYGRTTIQNILQKKRFKLSKQQLRLKLERMDKLGLLIVRPGRGGTTISEKRARYLKTLPLEDD